MKRRKLAIFATLLIIMLLFTACGKKTTSKKDTSKPITSETKVVPKESKNKKSVSQSKSPTETTSRLRTKQQNATDSNVLKGYSDSQIEYARVWLTLSGEAILDEEDLVLHAERISKGTPIFPELSENATYDNDVIKLYGDIPMVTPQLYSFPPHWASTNIDPTDKEAVEKYAEDVVKTTRTVIIPEGNPSSVKDIIERFN